MEVYSWEHHRTKWRFFHQTMFEYDRVAVPEMIFGDLRPVWVCPLELGYQKCWKSRNYRYRTWHFLALFIVSLPKEYYRYIMIDFPSTPWSLVQSTAPRCSGQSCARRSVRNDASSEPRRSNVCWSPWWWAASGMHRMHLGWRIAQLCQLGRCLATGLMWFV